MSKNPEGNYVDVPQSVVDYIQAYVGGHNNGVVGNWDGALMLDSVKNRVLLIGNQLPMDTTWDWMEPYCWYLHKVMKIITETIVPATEIMKEKQRLAKEHLLLWTLEAEHRKGCLGPWKENCE